MTVPRAIPRPTNPATPWLTTALRPAGPVSATGARRLAAALRAASACSEVLLVDLRAVGPLPRVVRRALADADARLAASGGALLVLDDEDGVDAGGRPSPAHLLPATAPVTAG